MKKREEIRAKRKMRIRKKIEGSAERPRLSVYRSAKHIYAQVVNDRDGKTLAAASSLSKDLKGTEGNKTALAKAVGIAVAKVCKDRGIDKVVFDRNGFIYHGRVKAVAEGAREGGLLF
jgi:large subunit ribosomal protein L18